jgi:hypothetical protein
VTAGDDAAGRRLFAWTSVLPFACALVSSRKAAWPCGHEAPVNRRVKTPEKAGLPRKT